MDRGNGNDIVVAHSSFFSSLYLNNVPNIENTLKHLTSGCLNLCLSLWKSMICSALDPEWEIALRPACTTVFTERLQLDSNSHGKI